MKFSNPIPRTGLVKFHEASPLRSLRDSDTVSALWKKDRKNGNQTSALTNATSQIQQQMMRLRPRALAPYQFHPFKVYQTPYEIALNKTKSWKTFQVRGGFIGWRSKYNTAVGDFTGYVGNNPVGNYELPIFIRDGSDRVVPFGLNGSTMSDFQSELTRPFYDFESIALTGFDIAVGSDTLATQFVLTDDDNPNTTWWNGAAFWVRIDDTDGDTVGTVEARMFGSDGANLTEVFPDDPTVFPLATVYPQRDNVQLYPNVPIQLTVTQVIYDHQLNRYPKDGMTFRGDWDDDSLSGQVFYPGDIVRQLDGATRRFYRAVGYGPSSTLPGVQWEIISKFDGT